MIRLKNVNLTQRSKIVLLILSLTLLVVIAYFVGQSSQVSSPDLAELPKVTIKEEKAVGTPKLKTETVLNGLSHPWDVDFLPDGTLIFSERGGQVSVVRGGKKQQVADIVDVYSVGEGGLTGLALDGDFKNNRYLYTCFNSQRGNDLDVRLVRWKLTQDLKLTDRNDIVTDMPSNYSGRHSGCRVKSAKDGKLWIGTGDAAQASNPQDPSSLGGKILRVDRNGKAVSGNLSPPFDTRIFSYGHRNTQGLVIFEKPTDGVYGYSVEHGSDRDDEVNLIKKGNFGWAPNAPYVENVPMTDTSRFPSAIKAIWSSGLPTIAPSGASLISGEKWGDYNGMVAMAVLKNQHVRLLKFDKNYELLNEKEILETLGRIRTTAMGSDGNLYISTDNGSNDKIIKVSPS